VYLLDTNHCSRLIDQHPAIVNRLEALGDAIVATCVIVKGELTFMVQRSEMKAENEAKVQALLQDMELFPVDDATADIYGMLKAGLLAKYGPKEKAARQKTKIERLGFSDNDLWIAAIAKCRDFIVVSADASFERMKDVAGLTVERWWSPELDRADR